MKAVSSPNSCEDKICDKFRLIFYEVRITDDVDEVKHL